MAQRLAEKGKQRYMHTNERIEDAVLHTYLLCKESKVDELWLAYRTDQFELGIWQFLTQDKGYSSLLIGAALAGVIWLGLRAIRPLLC